MNFLDPRLPEQFWDKVTPEPNSSCWLWTAFLNPKGYGIIRGKPGLTQLAHRRAFEALVGPVPAGLQLDHLCRTRACCNPAHLEPVTPQENTRRGKSGHNWRAKTHCPKGHPYSGDNLYIAHKANKGRGVRVCQTCRRAANLAQKAKQRGA